MLLAFNCNKTMSNGVKSRCTGSAHIWWRWREIRLHSSNVLALYSQRRIKQCIAIHICGLPAMTQILAKGLLMPKRCVSEFTAGLLVPVARSEDNKQALRMK